MSTPIELSAANVVSSWVENVSVLIAPAVSGLLLGVGGPELAIAAMGALSLGAAALVVPLPGPAPIHLLCGTTSPARRTRRSRPRHWRSHR